MPLPPVFIAHALSFLCTDSSSLLDKTLCAFPASSCHYHIHHCHHCDTWVRTWQINQTFSGWRDIFKALWWALLTAHREQRRTAAQKGLVVGMSSCQRRAGSYVTHSEGSLRCPTHLVHHVFSCKEHPPSLPLFSSLLWLVDLKIQRHILLAFFETLPSTGFSRGVLRRQEEKLTTLIWESWCLKVHSSKGGNKTYTMNHITQQGEEYQMHSSAPKPGVNFTTLDFYLSGYLPPGGLTCLWALRSLLWRVMKLCYQSHRGISLIVAASKGSFLKGTFI